MSVFKVWMGLCWWPHGGEYFCPEGEDDGLKNTFPSSSTSSSNSSLISLSVSSFYFLWPEHGAEILRKRERDRKRERERERERKKNPLYSVFPILGRMRCMSVRDIYLEVPGGSFRQEVETSRTRRLYRGRAGPWVKTHRHRLTLTVFIYIADVLLPSKPSTTRNCVLRGNNHDISCFHELRELSNVEWGIIVVLWHLFCIFLLY